MLCSRDKTASGCRMKGRFPFTLPFSITYRFPVPKYLLCSNTHSLRSQHSDGLTFSPH